jgi:hypothetical protein
MRSAKVILAVLVLALAASVAATPARADVSFGFFYSNLEPHGSWLVSGSYGRVWQPAAYAPGWNPYYDGHWAYTDAGWMWASDYSWGAIPYHYGTWAMDPRYGWVWVPGYTWAPAWVTFRTGPDYIGWAPVAPSFSVGVSFGVPLPTSAFVFVPTRSFMAPRIRTYAVPASRVLGVYRTTNVVSVPVMRHDAVVTRGPDPWVVERATRQPVRHTSIESASRMTSLDRRVTRGETRVTAPKQTQLAWNRRESSAPSRLEPRARINEQQRVAPERHQQAPQMKQQPGPSPRQAKPKHGHDGH